MTHSSIQISVSIDEAWLDIISVFYIDFSKLQYLVDGIVRLSIRVYLAVNAIIYYPKFHLALCYINARGTRTLRSVESWSG